MTFDINQNAYCLTINKEKFEFLCNRFKQVGLKPPAKFLGFVAKGDISYVSANTYGQISIVENARQKKLPYVIIYEDDAYPRNDVLQSVEKINTSLENNECDVLYLGRNGDAASWNDRIENLHHNPVELKSKYSNPVKIDENLSTIDKNVFGNHAYVVFRSGYDKYIYTMLTSMMKSNWTCYADIVVSSSPFLKKLHVTDPLFLQYNMNNGEIMHLYDWKNHKGYMVTEPITSFEDKRWTNG